MIFSIEDRLFEFFPGLTVGVLVARIDNTRYGDDVLESSLALVRAAFDSHHIEEHPNITVWKEAFSKAGMSDGLYESSVESLLVRALKRGVFPRVNPLVDLCVAASLEFLVPVGSHDISAVDGDICLGFAKGHEPFTPMEGGEDEVAVKGEVIYRDDCSVLTRGWVWRQSRKDRVSADSRIVFIPIDILDGPSATLANGVMDRLGAYLHENGSGVVIHRGIVTQHKTLLEFTT